MNLSELQKEHAEWQKRNFPDAEPWECLVGMQEELGELAAAVDRDDRSGIKDAIGDVMIYLIGFCTLKCLAVDRCVVLPSYRRIRWGVDASDGLSALQIALGKMCHTYLKAHQGIRRNERASLDTHIGILVSLLDRMTFHLPYTFTFENAVIDTWDIVKHRDWVAERESDD